METVRGPLFDTLSAGEKALLGDTSVWTPRRFIQHHDSPSDRVLRKSARDALSAVIPEYEMLARQVDELAKTERMRVPSETDGKEVTVRNWELPIAPDARGGFRWVQSSTWGAFEIRVDASPGPQATVRGRANYDSDDRLLFTVGMVSHFAISTV